MPGKACKRFQRNAPCGPAAPLLRRCRGFPATPPQPAAGGGRGGSPRLDARHVERLLLPAPGGLSHSVVERFAEGVHVIGAEPGRGGAVEVGFEAVHVAQDAVAVVGDAKHAQRRHLAARVRGWPWQGVGAQAGEWGGRGQRGAAGAARRCWEGASRGAEGRGLPRLRRSARHELRVRRADHVVDVHLLERCAGCGLRVAGCGGGGGAAQKRRAGAR